MKSMKNLLTGLLVVAMLIAVGLGCSNSDTTTTENKSNDNKSTPSPSPDATKSASKIDADDVSGSYSLDGKSLDGKSYDGDLTIKKQGEVYQFSWKVGGSAYDGVGVTDGRLIAVGYGAGDNGKGCGAAIYKIGDKTLEGILGGWGYNTVGKQSALRTKEDDKGELYTVSGTDTDGSDYSGNLYIAKSKTDVYHFAYSGGKTQYVGTGIRVGSSFGAGLGVKRCGYVVYEIKSDQLEAAWGIVGDDRLGTEIAKKNVK